MPTANSSSSWVPVLITDAFNTIKQNPRKVAAALLAAGAGYLSTVYGDDDLFATSTSVWAPELGNNFIGAMSALTVGMAASREHAGLFAVGGLSMFANTWSGVDAAAPTIRNPIPDQNASVGTHFSYAFKWDQVFDDADNDTLSISAKLSDGSPLPSWLNLKMFDYSYLKTYPTVGAAQDIDIINDTAYLIQKGPNRLETLNVSQALSPVHINTVHRIFSPQVIQIQGTIAYVAESSKLILFDISNPMNVNEIGSSYNLPTLAVGMDVYDAIAYVAHQSSGLSLINVTNTSNPSFLSIYDTPVSAWDVLVSGHIAYVCDSSSRIQILDVSNSSLPSFLSVSDNAVGAAYTATLQNDVLYVAFGSGGVLALNVTNSSAPVLLDQYDTPGNVLKLASQNDVLYVADDNRILVLNVTDPSQLAFTAQYDLQAQVSNLEISQGVLYVADSYAGLQLIDLERYPSNHYPVNIADAYLGSNSLLLTGATANQIRQSEGVTYVAMGTRGIILLDTNSVLTPTLISEYNTPDNARDVQIRGDIAYVADTSSIQILNVSNASSPSFIGNYTLPSVPTAVTYGIEVSGNIAYIAVGQAGLLVLNVSDPQSPQALSTYKGGILDARAIAITPNYVFMGDNSQTVMHIINVTDPVSPAQVLSFSTYSNTVKQIQRVDNLLYMRESGTLRIVDISDVTSPNHLSASRRFQFSFFDFFVSGHTALMGTGNGISIFDVSNSMAPYFIGKYPIKGQTYSLGLFGSTMYAVDNSRYIHYLDISPRTFYGTPTQDELLTIDVTATDPDGNSVTDQFELTVGSPLTTGALTTGTTATTGLMTTATTATTGTTASTGFGATASTGAIGTTANSLATTGMNPSTAVPSMTSGSPATGVSSATTTGSPQQASSTQTDEFPFWVWILVAVGGVGVCALIGLFLAYKQRQSEGSGSISSEVDMDAASDSSSPASVSSSSSAAVELAAAAVPPASTSRIVNRKEKHTIIGDRYALVNQVTKREAEEIFKQTGIMIDVPEGKKKVKVVLGQGQFGKLRIARRVEDGVYIAVKKIKGEVEIAASRREGALQEVLSGERNIMPILDHVESIGSEDEPVLYQFMPLAGFGNGSELQQSLALVTDTTLHAQLLTHYATSVLRGVSRMHAHDIYHLDFKLDNSVLDHQGTVNVIDFGCAVQLSNGQFKVSNGDTRYFSPERLAAYQRYIADKSDKNIKPIDAGKVDAWALGVTLLELALYRYPFDVCSMQERMQTWDAAYFEKVLGQIDLLQNPPPELENYMEVVRGLLRTDPKARLTVEDALQKMGDETLFADAEESSEIFSDLKSKAQAGEAKAAAFSAYVPVNRNECYADHYVSAAGSDASKSQIYSVDGSGAGVTLFQPAKQGEVPADYANDPAAFAKAFGDDEDTGAGAASRRGQTPLRDDYANDRSVMRT